MRTDELLLGKEEAMASWMASVTENGGDNTEDRYKHAKAVKGIWIKRSVRGNASYR